jgi:tRNA1(Val) A37 N6-methylase TrmN6
LAKTVSPLAGVDMQLTDIKHVLRTERCAYDVIVILPPFRRVQSQVAASSPVSVRQRRKAPLRRPEEEKIGE